MKQLLIEAKNEIEELRRHNDRMMSQLAIVDVFAAALGLKPDNRPMKPDIAWKLQQEIDRLAETSKEVPDVEEMFEAGLKIGLGVSLKTNSEAPSE